MAYSNTVALCDSSGVQFCGHVRTRDFAVDYEMSSGRAEWGLSNEMWFNKVLGAEILIPNVNLHVINIALT